MKTSPRKPSLLTVTSLLLVILTASVSSALISFFSNHITPSAHGGRTTAISLDAVNKPDTSRQTRITESYGKLPMSFEVNRGQTDARVKFLARGDGYSLFLTSSEAVLSLSKRARRPAGAEATALPSAHGGGETRRRARQDVLRMRLMGANPSPRVEGLEELPSKSNYLIGNDPQRWQTGIAHFARVKYEGVYRGVDMVYYGSQRKLEYDFIVAPGAALSSIRLAFAGALGVTLHTK